MAAVDPKAKLVTLTYPGGTATGPRGLMDVIFPSKIPSWFPAGEAGRGKKPFGTKQRDARQAGEDLTVQLKTGDSWVIRVTGTHTAFLTSFLTKGNSDAVVQVYSERGTMYGPQYGTIAPAAAEVA